MVPTCERAFVYSVNEFRVAFLTPLQPAQRPFKCIPRCWFVRSSRNDMIERHRDIGAERPLHVDRSLRRQLATASVHVALKLDAVFVPLPEALEREPLKAAGVGEQRPLPRHEL